MNYTALNKLFLLSFKVEKEFPFLLIVLVYQKYNVAFKNSKFNFQAAFKIFVALVALKE